MFTGIIEEVGVIKTLKAGQVYDIVIKCPKTAEKVNLGDSVAVNGICLTVTKIEGDFLSYNAVNETVNRTAFRTLRAGEPVNLETALTLSKPIGGHLVSGHIDGVASILNIIDIGSSKEITFGAQDNILKYIVEKGSVCIDGVSLTVASVNSDNFKVALIPHTLENTALKNKSMGALVNIECDIIGKYVEKLVSGKEKKSLLELLKEEGF